VSEEQRDLNRSRAVLVHTLQRIAQTGVMPSDRQNVRDLILDLDPPLDDQQGRNEARCEQRRRGEQWHVPRAPVPLPSAARAGGLTTDDLAWLLVQGEYLSAAVLRDTAQQTAVQRASLAGYLCEQCLDAPAVQLQPAPWGGEMGVGMACREPEGGTDAHG